MTVYSLGDVGRFVADKKLDVDKVIRGTLLDISASIVDRTPVGDPTYWKSGKAPAGYVGGTAKANWRAAIGAPDLVYANKQDKEGSSTIREISVVVDNAPDNLFFLTNSVPYIQLLEYGQHSKQAPGGMVRVTLAEFNKSVNEQIKKL